MEGCYEIQLHGRIENIAQRNFINLQIYVFQDTFQVKFRRRENIPLPWLDDKTKFHATILITARCILVVNIFESKHKIAR